MTAAAIDLAGPAIPARLCGRLTTLAELGVRRTTSDGLGFDFAGWFAANPAPSAGYLAVSEAGFASLRRSRLLPEPTAAASAFERDFLAAEGHGWTEAGIVLLHRPCLVDVARGSVLVRCEDGAFRPLRETVRPPDGGFGVEASLADWLAIEPDADGQVQAIDATAAAPGPLAPLNCHFSNNYFHLLTETLSALHMLARLDHHRQVAVLHGGTTWRPKCFAADMLRVAGRRDLRARARYVLCDRVVVGTGLCRYSRFDRAFLDAAHWLRRRLDVLPRDAPPEGIWWTPLDTQRGARRIYVSRTGASARRMTNEDALIDLVADFGFEIVDPAQLDLRGQIETFADAACILGPHGAGLINAVFAPPDADLIELRPLNRPDQSPMTNQSFRRLAALNGNPYGAMVFENPPGADSWRVDLDRVQRMLERLPRR